MGSSSQPQTLNPTSPFHALAGRITMGPTLPLFPIPPFLSSSVFFIFPQSPLLQTTTSTMTHIPALSSTPRLASRRTPAPKANPQPQRPPHSASDHDGGRSCCCDPGRCAGVMARRWMRVLVATLVFAGTGEPFWYIRCCVLLRSRFCAFVLHTSQ